MVSPSARSYGQQLAGHLSKFWNGGAGPTTAQIDSAFLSVGIDPLALHGNKQQRVQQALMAADNQTAVDLTEELLDLLREGRHISAGGYPDPQLLVEGLRQALIRLGGDLDAAGYVTWPAGDLPDTPPAVPAPARPELNSVLAGGRAGLFQPRTGSTTLFGVGASATAGAPPGAVAGPPIDLLVQMLRHVPAAARSLRVRTRTGKEPLPLVDEYDLQDLTSFALRLLYRDVKAEEPAPSFAGKSTRADFLVKELRAAVEVKVTRRGRGERPIGEEIVLDQRYYSTHPYIDGLVAVVYDLAGTFTNIAGFEQQLSGQYDGLWARTVVVPWPPAGS